MIKNTYEINYRLLEANFSFLSEIFHHYFFLLLPLSLINAFFSAVTIQLPAIQTSTVLMSLGTLSIALINIFWSIATIALIASRFSNESFYFRHIYLFAIKHFLPITTLYSILFLGFSVGFILFIIPGLYISLRTSFADYNYLFREESMIASIKTSWKQTQSKQWLLLKGYLLLFIIALPVSFISTLLESDHFVTIFIGDLAYNCLYPLITIFSFLVFRDTTTQKNTNKLTDN